MFKPSPEQENLFNFVETGKGSCVLEAVAGSGKTTTAIEALKRMKGSIFFGAYSKDIAEEIKARCPKDMKNLTTSTFHAAGLSVWRKANPKVRVDANKCRGIFRKIFTSEENAPFEGCVVQLVSYAKQIALGIESSIDDFTVWMNLVEHFDVECFDKAEKVIEMAQLVYKKSLLADSEVVDFDDMVIAGLIHDCKFPVYDFVVCDEAQDMNLARRIMAKKMAGKNGRMIIIGDRNQSIYSFTGADIDSLDIMGKMMNAIHLPLSVSFRCPQAVVKEAQKYVTHIKAHESAPMGSVSRLPKDKNIVHEAKVGDAILCRFNAPLVKLVYKFIAEGIPSKIEGREIGKGLQVLARKYKVKNFSSLIDKLNDYRYRESNKYRAKENETAAVAVEDKVDCLKVIIDRVMKVDPNAKHPIERLCQEIDNIFDENVSGKYVLLSSYHKSKGREWKNVFILETGENKRAKQQWQIDAEINLKYVSVTRAKENLIYFSLDK